MAAVCAVLWMWGLAVGRLVAQSQAEQGATAPAAGGAALPRQSSLGDLARKVRADRANQKPSTRVFTNSNLPTEGGLSVIGPGAEAPPAPAAASAAGTAHDAKWFTARMAELQGRLAMHQRELDVLQQKLGLAQTLYYPDPNKALQQQYSLSDIKNLQKAIGDKQQQIADDKMAIEALRTELQREGGDPGWLRAGMASAGSAPALPPPPEVTPGEHDRGYWQARFKQARERVAAAREQESLAEEEVDLLKKRQASELAQSAQGQIGAKLTDAEDNRRAAQDTLSKAEADLATLERKFQESGAPPDWVEAQ